MFLPCWKVFLVINLHKRFDVMIRNNFGEGPIAVYLMSLNIFMTKMIYSFQSYTV